MNTPQINKLSRASQLSLLAIVILLGAIFFTVNSAMQQQNNAGHANTTTYSNIFIRSTSQGSNSNVSHFTLSKPSSVVAGDVMIAQVVVRGATTTISPPSGWTLIGRVNTDSLLSQALYRHVATGVDASTFTWNFDSATYSSGGIVDLANVDTSDPIDAHSARFNASLTTITANSVTTTTPADELLFFAGVVDHAIVNSPSGGMQGQYTAATTQTTSWVSASKLTASGDTGNRTALSSLLTSNLAQLVAVKPVATTVIPTATRAPQPTPTPTIAIKPTATPTPRPTAVPTKVPTAAPTPTPTPQIPPAPTGLTATPGDGKVTLNWTAIGGDYYYIYVKNVTAGETSFTKLPSPVTTNSFTYTPIPNGQTFQFKVSAIGTNSVEGPQSAVVSAIPSASAPTPTTRPTPTPTLRPTATPTCAPPPTCFQNGVMICLIPAGGWCGFGTPTPKPSPTSIPQPTDTPVPGSTVLSVTIGLHGIGNGGDSANPNSTGNMSPLRPQRDLTVEIYDVQNQLVVSQQGTINYDQNSGKFLGTVDLGTSFTTGLYTVKVKADQYLRAIVPGIQTITAGQTTTLPAVSLIAGDINGDNAINIVDYNLLIGCYSDLLPPTDCPAGEDVLTDLTDDGHVNQFDYNLFLRELTNIGGQ